MSNAFVRCKTPAFAHNSLAFSPFFDNVIAVASGANYGIVGNGRIHILLYGAQGLGVTKFFETQDSVYDVAWNETHENQVVAACGNGAVKLFDITLEGHPIQNWHEHAREVETVDWSNLAKGQFVTASWDSTCKIWSVDRVTSIATIQAAPKTHPLSSAMCSPHSPFAVATTATDGHLRLWDIRVPTEAKPVVGFPSHEGDTIHCDWNKYREGVLATAGKEGLVRLFDVRNPSGPTGEIRGHQMGVRKVQWSPHHADILATASYDMTSRILSTTSEPSTLAVHDAHSEFVIGCAWALYDEGLLATCSWDSEVHLFKR